MAIGSFARPIRRPALRLLVFLLFASLAMAETPAALWLDVPFVAQPKEGCGAASLSMLMQYWDKQQNTPPTPGSNVDAIQHLLYSPKDHGITADAMQHYLQQHGYQAFTLHGTWADLETELARGRPLIAALRPQGQSELHYVVIDGIDSKRSLITMNDPAERKLLNEERVAFERDWSATHNWLLLAVPAATSGKDAPPSAR